jgi:hypothetical protein
MKNFMLLAQGIDVFPLNLALKRNPGLWNVFNVRKAHDQSVHKGFDDIVLRYNKYEPGEDFVDKVCSRIEVVNYPTFDMLPEARALVMSLMARVAGEHLGRVFISRLAPGMTIPLHSDRIEPAEKAFPDRIPPAVYYDRYHIVVHSTPGVMFVAGDEQVTMSTGEAWWFDNQQLHTVVNNSDDDRIHLVIDIAGYRNWYVPKRSES